MAEKRRERRAVQLLGDVERLAAVALQHRLEYLHPGLVGLRQEARETALHPPAHADRDRRLPLVDAEQFGDVGALVGRGHRRQNRQREADTLRNLPTELDGLDAEPGRNDYAPFRFDLGRFEAADSQELELWSLRQERVDLAIDDLVAGVVLALLHDDPPAEDANLLDGVGVRDGLDGVHGLNAGQLAHSHLLCSWAMNSTPARGGEFADDHVLLSRP